MKEEYDAIIVGVGAKGSAAAYLLASRNIKILGIDCFAPPHSIGSSHRQTRIIREAHFKGTQYVPIIQQSYTNRENRNGISGSSSFSKPGNR